MLLREREYRYIRRPCTEDSIILGEWLACVACVEFVLPDQSLVSGQKKSNLMVMEMPVLSSPACWWEIPEMETEWRTVVQEVQYP